MSNGTLNKGSLVKGGQSSSGSSGGANLYDIKTLSQAITNKGWACISQNKSIAKSSVPTLSADLTTKRNGVDVEFSFTSKFTISSSSQVVYYNNYYYYYNNGLYRTSDINNAGSSVASDIYGGAGLLLAGQYVVSFSLVGGSRGFSVYNTSTGNCYSCADDNLYSALYFYDDKLVYSGWYIDYSNLGSSELASQKVSGTNLAQWKAGNTYYRLQGGGETSIYYGSSFDNCNTLLFESYDYAKVFVKNDKLLWCSVDGGHTTLVIDNGQIEETLSSNLYNIVGINDIDGIIAGNDLYVWSISGSNYVVAKSSDNGETWTDYSTSALSSYTSVRKNLSYVNSILVAVAGNGSPYDFCVAGNSAKEYTDTINGVSQVYYYNSIYKIKFAKNTTNKSSIVSYLGYWNYYYVEDSTNITLPQNNNMWTWLYVGDDFEETSIPSGNVKNKSGLLYGTSAPTTSTVGIIGDIYIDTTNVAVYICAGISGSTYTWKQISLVS